MASASDPVTIHMKFTRASKKYKQRPNIFPSKSHHHKVAETALNISHRFHRGMRLGLKLEKFLFASSINADL